MTILESYNRKKAEIAERKKNLIPMLMSELECFENVEIEEEEDCVIVRAKIKRDIMYERLEIQCLISVEENNNFKTITNLFQIEDELYTQSELMEKIGEWLAFHDVEIKEA